MPSFRKACVAFSIIFVASSGAHAQPVGDRPERSRTIDFDTGAERRRIEIYEPPPLVTRRRLSVARAGRPAVPPWWEIVDDPAPLRRDRRAAWYFGLPTPYQYRRFQ